jgi:hypothetical protein
VLRLRRPDRQAVERPLLAVVERRQPVAVLPLVVPLQRDRQVLPWRPVSR